MICGDIIRSHSGWERPKRGASVLLLALFLAFAGGAFLLGWASKSVAVETQKEAVEVQSEAGEAPNDAAEAQDEAAETSAPAEKEKSTFDSVKGVFSSWGHKAGIKKDKLSIKYDMRKLRGKIDKDYQELGRVFFALYRDGAKDVLNDPKLKDLLGSIVEKQAELEKLEARLAELKTEEGDEESGEGTEEVQEDAGSAVEEKPSQ
ncbi:MAG: hypothetical protein HY788_10715 [Deltaproteobacteria bacterium]|nr:hypothetical protein [Deltaproteobacteria bacterium]